MRRICGFKLELHCKEVRRRVRKAVDLAALGLEDEAPLQKFLDNIITACRPAVLFDSLSAESKETAGLSPIPGLAHSIGLATLGPDVEEKIAQASSIADQRGRLAEMTVSFALEEAVQFVTEIINDEAEAERCELSPLQYLEGPAVLETVLAKLQGEKIGLSIKEGRLVPAYSSAFCVSWIAQGRSRSKTNSKTAAGRGK